MTTAQWHLHEIMKCFERLVLYHIKASLPSTSDEHQFAYRTNRSTEDAIALALHTVLRHLEKHGNYVRMLFIDYSSAFNTIIPDILVSKLTNLGLPILTCHWIKDFLTNRSQRVKMGPHVSSICLLSIGSPQGCVLSPLLYSLYTYDCSPVHRSNTIIKFSDDTTVIGLITGGDEMDYRDEVQQLTSWSSANNLTINTSKTKELVIDFRKHKTDPLPLYINGDCVERVQSFKFLGTLISADLSWKAHTTAVIKKARQRLHFLRILRKNYLNGKLLVNFYHCSIESVLTYCITVWHARSSEVDKRGLQMIIKAAERITGSPLPSLKDLYNSQVLNNVKNILKDSTHPSFHLFQLLPSGRRYRCFKSRTRRYKDSFFPRAINIVNSNMQ